MFIILQDHAQIYWEYLGWHSFHTSIWNFTLTFFFWEKKNTDQYKKICIERLFFFFKCCHTNNKDPLPWSDEDWNAAPPQVGPQSTAATMAGISQRFTKFFFSIWRDFEHWQFKISLNTKKFRNDSHSVRFQMVINSKDGFKETIPRSHEC